MSEVNLKGVPEFLKVTVRDSKGRIVKHVPYRMHCEGATEYYEVPKGSGYWQTYHGKPLSAEVTKRLVTQFPVQESPKTLDQMVQQKKLELAAIEAELAEKKVVSQAVEKKSELDAVEKKQVKSVSEAKAQLAELKEEKASSVFGEQLKGKQAEK